MPPRPAQRRHNLPTQLTSFIGREREIAEIKRLLGTTRLLTLTGSGGCGKTRLALQVATGLLDQYPDGVWFVDLAPLTDPAFVPNSVAAALNVVEQPIRSLRETLTDFVQTKSLLLVLDNCEHLRVACQGLVDRLLRASSTFRILATSREALGVEGELTYRVPPLGLPEVREAPLAADLTKYDAIRLFAERAALRHPDFTITAVNARAVLQICQRLDGMPLAIEFAAARVRTLSVEQIAARLDDRFRLLTAGTRQTVPRQQTLRATMDWSYDLLSEPERAVLRRLSVFAGGWTLEAAEAVCAEGDVEAAGIMDLLTQLVDKSIVVAETRGTEARYKLLETVRQYGRNRLAESVEAEAVTRRHRDWFLALAERAELELHGPEQVVWLDRLEMEHDNLRAALKWSRAEEGGSEAEAGLAGALWLFWFVRGHWNEGRRWLDEAATKAAAPLFALRAREGAAFFAYQQSDYSRATILCEQGIVLCGQLGDQERFRWLATFCRLSGMIALYQGDLRKAETEFDLGLARAREVGDWYLIGLLLCHLASLRMYQERYEAAEKLFTESLSIARKIGDGFLTSLVLCNQGYLFLRQADEERAAASFSGSLALSRNLQDHYISHLSLEGLAAVSFARGRHDLAVLLLSATDASRRTTGRGFRGLSLATKKRRDDYCAAARAELGEVAFAAAWTHGQEMTLEQIVGYALETVSPMVSRSASAGRDGKGPADLLTTREQEVVSLVVQGLTNRQIAVKLVVTERTVETHLHNILHKLDFTSRTEVAVWAVKNGRPKAAAQ